MYKFHWTSEDILSYEQWLNIKSVLETEKVIGFDTETTGLHIIQDVPFIIQFGYVNPKTSEGFTYLIDSRDLGVSLFLKIAKELTEAFAKADQIVGAHVLFDLHMLNNIGCRYTVENVTDIQFFIRYGTDALPTKKGGAPLKLKDFTAQYIDRSAKYHEKELAAQRKQIAETYNKDLKKRMNMTIKQMDKIFKDVIFEISDAPEEFQNTYKEWVESLPKYLQYKVTSTVDSDMIRYDKLDKPTLHKYAHLDVVDTLEVYYMAKPVVEFRENMEAVHREEKQLLPLFDMERAGLFVDKDYLETARIALKQEIIAKRKQLEELAHQKISVNQHAEIKKVLENVYHIKLASVGAQALEETHIEDPEARKFIKTIIDLRSLEKWYSTYITKFTVDLRRSDRIYTEIHQVGTVSGRVSCDFQQFPKEPLLRDDGTELFHPRRMIKCPENGTMLLIDYAAEELRFTAMYTVLVGDPDENMLRAYMPYNCDPETWEPVDLHAATTIAAGYSKDDPDFKHYRKTIGKRVNFAKNYGAAYDKIRTMFPDKSEEECHRIDEAYYKAFPGLKTYAKYCTSRARLYPYTENMFGVKYWHCDGHHLRNYLVQGSCAAFLKERIRAIWEFLRANNCKSVIAMQIHDELMYYIAPGEEWIKPKLKEIMEDFPDAIVPIVAEPEETKTNWADKKEVTL